MAKPKFYDVMGAPIEKDRWKELSADPAYCSVMLYDNQSLKVELVWVGKVADPTMMDSEYWPLFRLDIFDNTGDNGETRWTPSMDTGETYGSTEAGKKAYRDYLLEWTESTMEEGRKGALEFVEADNLAAPPPPPDFDAPTSVVTIGEDGSGVW
jgi:hypothetical protein